MSGVVAKATYNCGSKTFAGCAIWTPKMVLILRPSGIEVGRGTRGKASKQNNVLWVVSEVGYCGAYVDDELE